MKKFKGILLAGAAIAALGFSAQKAEASSGFIADPVYQREVVGVWVEVKGGRSGWAHYGPTIRGQKWSVNWNYDTQGKPFQLHIGVGGSRQNWGRNIKTRWINGNTVNGQVNITPGNTAFVTGMP